VGILLILIMGSGIYYALTNPIRYTEKNIKKNIYLIGNGTSAQQLRAWDKLYSEAAESIDILSGTLAGLEAAMGSENQKTKERAGVMYGDLAKYMAENNIKPINNPGMTSNRKTGRNKPQLEKGKGFFSSLWPAKGDSYVLDVAATQFRARDFWGYDLYETSVKYVNDGDTIQLFDGTSVRYLGIDTPEVDHYDSRKSEEGAEEAFRFNKLLTGDKDIILAVPRQENRDRYGRLLAYVYVPAVTSSGRAYVNMTKLLLKKNMGNSRYGAPDSALPLAVSRDIRSSKAVVRDAF